VSATAAWTVIKFHETQLQVHFSYAQHRQAAQSRELVAPLQDIVSQTFLFENCSTLLRGKLDAVSTHLPQPIRKFRVGMSLWAAPVVHARPAELRLHKIHDCSGTLTRFRGVRYQLDWHIMAPLLRVSGTACIPETLETHKQGA
jgi:hypothetical protein